MSNILVVDDEKGIRESLNILLTDEGYQIDMASDGMEALTLLEKKQYDLVLTDLRMPNMNGMSLLSQIKEKWDESIPVIMLTSCGHVDTAIQAIKEGASDFIIKPFEVDHLRESVRKALKKEREKMKQAIKAQEEYARRMENANRKLDHAIFELAVLHETGKMINSTLDIKKIVSIILEMARQSVGADRARVLLYYKNSQRNMMDLVYSVDDSNHGQLEAVDEYAAAWVRRRGEGILLEDIEKIPPQESQLLAGSGLGSLVVLPIKRKSDMVGAMILNNRTGSRKFTEQDFQFLTTLVNQASIAIENAQLYDELQDHFADTIRALVTAMEAKDAYTYGHSDRVTQYSLMIAGQLGLSELDVRELEYTALLHDIGKIGIAEEILRKPGKLDQHEWSVVKKHTILGSTIVRPIKFLNRGEETVRHHHEWFNGSGYPDGLKGEDIPLFSRIIAVADAFDAMISERPYRSSMTEAAAMHELSKCSGEQFDPTVVATFTRALETARLAS
ncbi:MAG: HD domain-containing phosphohydrolase [candidate division FCPU426 bacterium]